MYNFSTETENFIDIHGLLLSRFLVWEISGLLISCLPKLQSLRKFQILPGTGHVNGRFFCAS